MPLVLSVLFSSGMLNLLLDLYHAKLSQDLHMNQGPLWHVEATGRIIKVFKKSIPLDIKIYDVSPSTSCPNSRVPINGYWLDTYYWTCTMPGSARTCTWAMAFLRLEQRHREAPGAVESVVLFNLEFWTVKQNLICVVEGICQCSCLGIDHSFLWI